MPLIQAVTYIDETKCLRTYRFEGIEIYGCSDKLAKRLRTTTEKLVKKLNSRRLSTQVTSTQTATVPMQA